MKRLIARIFRRTTGGDIRIILNAHTAILESGLAVMETMLLVLQSIQRGENRMSKEVDDMNGAITGLTTAVANNGAAITQLAQAQIANKDDPAKVEAGAQQILALTAQLNSGTQAAIDAAGALTSATPTATTPAPTTPTPDASAALATVTTS